jgi:pimeloyl-ACP methyl ester carboxylesterase
MSSTPAPQPHALADDVDDLRAVLAAAGETGPFVLAAHSYGGLIDARSAVVEAVRAGETRLER